MERDFEHNRRSIRLKGYDYSAPGEYFVTICTQNRKCLFGEIRNHTHRLSQMGRIAESLWQEIPQRYENVGLDAWVIMPNHMHCIIGIIGETNLDNLSQSRPRVGAIHELSLRWDASGRDLKEYRKYRRNMLLPKVIGWYKMNVSKRINQIRNTPGEKVWQRNYYEHIIRNERSLKRIRQYIINNPAQWVEDRNYPDNSNLIE